MNNERVKLTPREFAILELLVSNPGIVLSAEQIYEKVWKEEAFQSENTVMVHIRKIRERIETNPRNPQYIKTVWGVGYKVEKIFRLLRFPRFLKHIGVKIKNNIQRSIRIQLFTTFLLCALGSF